MPSPRQWGKSLAPHDGRSPNVGFGKKIIPQAAVAAKDAQDLSILDGTGYNIILGTRSYG